MKSFSIIIIFLTFCLSSFGQDKIIDSLIEYGRLQEAESLIREDIRANSINKTNAYRLAEIFSIQDDVNESYKYLQFSLEKDSTIDALKNPLFFNLSKSDKWENIVNDQIRKYQNKNGKFSNPEYARILFQIVQKDQLFYYEIEVAQRTLGRNSPVTKALWELKNKINKDLLVELETLIAKYGYPKCSENMPCSVPFLVIQHSDLKVQEKYLGLIKDLCEREEIPCNHYAMLIDRIRLRKKEPQIYGTQLKYGKNNELILYDLENPENVNKRREKLNLEPLKNY